MREYESTPVTALAVFKQVWRNSKKESKKFYDTKIKKWELQLEKWTPHSTQINSLCEKWTAPFYYEDRNVVCLERLWQSKFRKGRPGKSTHVAKASRGFFARLDEHFLSYHSESSLNEFILLTKNFLRTEVQIVVIVTEFQTRSLAKIRYGDLTTLVMICYLSPEYFNFRMFDYLIRYPD